MKCEIKYRPIISQTLEEDRRALKKSYLHGDGICPACLKDGRSIPIEERFGEST